MTRTATAPAVFARVERFASVGSTNDVVRAWLEAGEPEVCMAVAREQTAGRGRHGRTWTAPAGAALLATLGFRPSWLAADRTWRLAACVALAMCDAAEGVAGLPAGGIHLKWPNDLVIETTGPNALVAGDADEVAASWRLAAPIELRKLAGVLGESDGLGSADPRVVVGIGMNADWRAADFPPDLAGSMTSLREAAGGQPIPLDGLLAAFQARLEARIAALRTGSFDLAAWAGRQSTTGRMVTLDDGAVAVEALGVDAASGGLVVADPTAAGGERVVHAGEVRRVRLAGAGV